MKKWLSVSFLAWILGIASCEKSEPIPDPCKDAQPFEADFTIFEAVKDSLVATDKVLLYSSVTFSPVEDYDSYEWQVGNEHNVSTERNYSLIFPELVNDVEVRLIARKSPGECFPDDKTIDTVYHTLSVVPWGDAAILGKYVGSYERTPHLIDTVEISYSTTAESPDPFGEFKVLNVNRGCDIDKYPHGACPMWARGYRAFAIFTDLCKKCPGTKGLIKLIDENTLEANITYGDTTKWGSWPLPELDDKFTGTRVAE